MPELLYLAAPYSDPSPLVRLMRFREANLAAARLMAAGHGVISPLSMGVPIAAARPGEIGTDWEAWKDVCLRMLERCDAVCVLPLPGWKASVGVRAELQYAGALGLAIRFVSFPENDQVAFTDREAWGKP